MTQNKYFFHTFVSLRSLKRFHSVGGHECEWGKRAKNKISVNIVILWGGLLLSAISRTKIRRSALAITSIDFFRKGNNVLLMWGSRMKGIFFCFKKNQDRQELIWKTRKT